jgi:hypothetical protein
MSEAPFLSIHLCVLLVRPRSATNHSSVDIVVMTSIRSTTNLGVSAGLRVAARLAELLPIAKCLVVDVIFIGGFGARGAFSNGGAVAFSRGSAAVLLPMPEPSACGTGTGMSLPIAAECEMRMVAAPWGWSLEALRGGFGKWLGSALAKRSNFTGVKRLLRVPPLLTQNKRAK